MGWPQLPGELDNLSVGVILEHLANTGKSELLCELMRCIYTKQLLPSLAFMHCPSVGPFSCIYFCALHFSSTFFLHTFLCIGLQSDPFHAYTSVHCFCMPWLRFMLDDHCFDVAVVGCWLRSGNGFLCVGCWSYIMR